jgi:hypothetical protein
MPVEVLEHRELQDHHQEEMVEEDLRLQQVYIQQVVVGEDLILEQMEAEDLVLQL